MLNRKNNTEFIVDIDSSCINCDMCVPECPSDAIEMGSIHYHINNDTCIRCEDYYAAPNCIEICPIGSVWKHPFSTPEN